MKSDISDRYDTLNMDLSFLDQFDNDNIIELELRDQSGIRSKLLDQFDNNIIVKLELMDKRSKHPLY